MGTVRTYRAERMCHAAPLGGMLRAGSVVTVGDDFFRSNGREVQSPGAGDFARRLADKTDFLVEVKGLDEGDVAQGSCTSAVWPLLGCLRAAERFVGAERGDGAWTPTNDRQTSFLEAFLGHLKRVDALEERVGCLESRADTDIGPINKWLRERGFTIELTVSPGPEGFAVASILDVLCEWLEKGTRRTIEKGGETYDAVKLKKGVSLVQHPDLHDHPIVRVAA